MIQKSSGFVFKTLYAAIFAASAMLPWLENNRRVYGQEIDIETVATPTAIQMPSNDASLVIQSPNRSSFQGNNEFGSPLVAPIDPEALISPNEIFVPQPEDLEKIASNDPRIKSIDPEKVESPTLDLYSLSVERYSIYRREDNSVVYMPGNGEQFGWLSFASSNYLSSKKKFWDLW